MANSDKNIIITPNTNQSGLPKIEFVGSSSVPITLSVLDNTSISFSSSAGQLFSISNNLTEGTIFSVNDVSGIPSIEVDASGTVSLAEFGGNVGIGTSNPQHKLTVVGTAAITNLSASTVSSSLIPSQNEIFDLGSPNFRWRDLYLSGSTIYLGGKTISIEQDALKVDSNFILTSSTGQTEQLANSLNPGSYISGSSFDGSATITWTVDATSANTASKVVARDASGNFGAGTITAAGLTVDTNTLHVDATNNRVGIGTTSPDNTFHVHKGSAGTVTGASSTNVLVLENSTSNFLKFNTPDNSFAGLNFGFPGTGEAVNIGSIMYGGPTAAINPGGMRFLVGGIDRVVVNSAGRVGIGTTSPTSGFALDVSTTINDGWIKAGGLSLNTTNQAFILEVQGDARITDSVAIGTNLLYANNSNGRVGIGTISPGSRLEVNGNIKFTSNGQGIDFGNTTSSTGTSSGTILDDYEEGTWSPTISWNGVDVQYANRGRYIKIGKMVMILVDTGFVTVPNTVSDASINIKGMPFSPDATYLATGGMFNSDGIYIGSGWGGIWSTVAQTQIFFSAYLANGAAIGGSFFSLNTGFSTRIQYSISYKVA